MSDPETCPECGACVTKLHFHRHGWYYADCGRRYHWERGEWEPIEPEECLRRQLAQRDATIAKLQAIMDRLPKTADGVVMLPNDTVWFADPWDGKVRSAKLPALGCTMTYPPFVCADDLTEPDYLTRDVPSVEWYSTRAAIELAAAQAADLPGGGGNGDDR